MSNKELKKMLAESYQLESELIDFCKECLEEIFPGNKCVVAEFLEDVEHGYNYNGCIQSLYCIKKNLERREEMRKEREKEN